MIEVPGYAGKLQLLGTDRGWFLDRCRELQFVVDDSAPHRPGVQSILTDLVPESLRTPLLKLSFRDTVLCSGTLDAFTLYFSDGAVSVPRAGGDIRLMRNPMSGSHSYNAFNFALFAAFVRQRGLIMHGLAFRFAGRDILALGESGAGKSTLAAAVLSCGGAVVSDDQVLLGEGRDGGLFARYVRRNIRLREGALSVLKPDRRGNLLPQADKADVRWMLSRKNDSVEFLPAIQPTEVWVLDSSERPRSSELLAESQALAFAAMLAATSLQLLSDRGLMGEKETLSFIPGLLARLRCYRARIGENLLSDPCEELRRLVELG